MTFGRFLGISLLVRWHLRIALVVFSLVLVPAARAQDRIYIDFQDSSLVGESTDPNHPGWVEAYSLDHGAANAPAVDYTPINLFKGIDRASPRLSWLTAAGTTLTNDVIVDVCRETAGGSQECYYRLTLRGVVIESVQTSAASCLDPSSCSGRQSESLSLTWARLKWVVTTSDGKTTQAYTACYDKKGTFACF